VHHSTFEPETNSNYGAVFPIWDLLLGTFRGSPRQPHTAMSLGLEELRGSEAQRLGFLLVSPLRGRLRTTSGDL
jgi:sterol desaturase/sphingolipid hydroxylase (fatty acid hydroxylase superfamily)